MSVIFGVFAKWLPQIRFIRCNTYGYVAAFWLEDELIKEKTQHTQIECDYKYDRTTDEDYYYYY